MARDKRTYTSPLREQQAEATRIRILDGAIQVLASGAAALTIPAVAREAGVAVPTVYRHFPTKEAMEDAVVEHVRMLAGVRDGTPATLDALFERVDQIWTAMDAMPRSHLALLAATVGRELMDPPAGRDRREFVRRALAEPLEGVAPEVAAKVEGIAAALASSPGAMAFLRTGIPLDEASELFAFLVRALIREARSGLE